MVTLTSMAVVSKVGTGSGSLIHIPFRHPWLICIVWHSMGKVYVWLSPFDAFLTDVKSLFSQSQFFFFLLLTPHFHSSFLSSSKKYVFPCKTISSSFIFSKYANPSPKTDNAPPSLMWMMCIFLVYIVPQTD